MHYMLGEHPNTCLQQSHIGLHQSKNMSKFHIIKHGQKYDEENEGKLQQLH